MLATLRKLFGSRQITIVHPALGELVFDPEHGGRSVTQRKGRP